MAPCSPADTVIWRSATLTPAGHVSFPKIVTVSPAVMRLELDSIVALHRFSSALPAGAAGCAGALDAIGAAAGAAPRSCARVALRAARSCSRPARRSAARAARSSARATCRCSRSARCALRSRGAAPCAEAAAGASSPSATAAALSRVAAGARRRVGVCMWPLARRVGGRRVQCSGTLSRPVYRRSPRDA